MPRDRFGRDIATLNSLPRIDRSGTTEAYLSWNEGGNIRLWTFLYPIQELNISTRINYEIDEALGTNSKTLYWRGNDPKTISLDGLILDTYRDRRSVRPLLEGIELLSQASKDRRSPPVLSFVCGNIRLTACVLTGEISYRIERMHRGEVIGARLNLQLTAVDAGQIVLPSAPPIPASNPVILIPQIVAPVVVTPAPTPSPSSSTTPGTAPTTPTFTGDVAKGVYFFGGCTSWGAAQDGEDGIIATAQHCLAASKTVTIDGKKYQYTTIGQNTTSDVAIVRVKNVKINVLKIRKSTADLKKGDEVYSIGFPGGDPTPETTRGTIASNPLGSGESEYHDPSQTPSLYIRYSARFLHPGNSGGPQFLSSTNEVISSTHGGAQNTGQASTADQFKYPKADNKPTGSKSENTLTLLKNAGINVS